MAKLMTDFIKIAQAGPCVDGRFIKAEWLMDMAETYAPVTYTSKIWPEHRRWGNNYGSVLELQYREEDGQQSLYARLAPNAQYVWDNQFDQLLNFSIEVQENFAGTGKAYLVGLGITDSPASLGTDELHFSTRHTARGTAIYSNVPACSVSPADNAVEPSWFTAFKNSLFTPKNISLQSPITHEEPHMDDKQFSALMGKVDAIGSDVATLKTTFAALEQKPATPVAPESAHPAPANPAVETRSAELVALDGVIAAITGLRSEITTMNGKFSAPMPGTTAPANTGPSTDAPLL